MSARRGAFFVLEGLDGAGTTTQSRLLDSSLRQRGLPAWLTCEPTEHAIGRLIRQALSERPRRTGPSGGTRLSERALCLLFAADRSEHSTGIESARRGGTHVICDRYVLSSIAYQSLELSPERVVDVNRDIAVPDLTIFLDVPVGECLERLTTRKQTPTIYEKREVLEKIDASYRTSMALYRTHFGSIVRVDGTGSPEAVHRAIVEHVAPFLPS